MKHTPYTVLSQRSKQTHAIQRFSSLTTTAFFAGVVTVLTACGGSSSTPTAPTIKKTINGDNLDNALSAYLLYHYRLDVERIQLGKFTNYAPAENGTANCPIQGTVQVMRLVDFQYTFNACKAADASIYSGAIKYSFAQGPVKTNFEYYTELNYQMLDDLDIIKLSGSYADDRFAARSRNFNLSYNTGTKTYTYSTDSSKLTDVNISSTAISGNQQFILTDLDTTGKAITPTLRANDGSNITIIVDTSGSINVALRNDADGSIIGSRLFSKSEVDQLLKGARHTKS